MIHVLIGPGWATSGRTRVRGHAFDGERFLPAGDVAHKLDALKEVPARWAAAVASLNGNFAVVSETDDGALAAVDRIRTTPLFFATAPGELRIASSAEALRQTADDRAPDPVVALEYLLTGYTTGNDTLAPGIRQLRAGEWLHARRDGTIALARHYAFHHRDFFGDDEAVVLDRLHEVHHRVFGRLVAGLQGRPIVLPLSGGYDSRLIAVGLKEHGAREVFCYNYGVAGHWETSLSRELARHLGYAWEFVPYSAGDWQRWVGGEDFARYARSAGNLVSIPHAQDWPAIRDLLARGRIVPGSVVVPGHTGDFLTGGHIPPALVRRGRMTHDDLLAATLTRHYCLWPWSAEARRHRQDFATRVANVIGAVPEVNPESAADGIERWDLEERQAKFICNSLRVYEFFGLDWRVPLYDHELMDFWARVPVDARFGRRLYFDYVARHQQLPLRNANTDRSAAAALLVATLTRLGLREAAKKLRRHWRRWRWQEEWEIGSEAGFAWFGAVDRDYFRRTYRGGETLHSYMAVRYFVDALGRDRAIPLLNAIGYGRLAPPG